MRERQDKSLIFKVIVSEQDNGYSFWVVDRENPPGWHEAGRVRGTATECLAYINQIRIRERPREPAPEFSSAPEEAWNQRAVGV